MKEQFAEIKLKEVVQDARAGNSYKMIFEDIDGSFLLPVMISAYDAQPLMAMLDGESTRRPRTHEFFCNFITVSGYKLSGIYIVDFKQGVFHTTAIFTDGERTVELDCRPSDAACIALQCGAPVFVDNAVAEKVAMMVSAGKADSVESRLKALHKRLDRLVSEERYEDAARIRDKIEHLSKDNL